MKRDEGRGVGRGRGRGRGGRGCSPFFGGWVGRVGWVEMGMFMLNWCGFGDARGGARKKGGFAGVRRVRSGEGK